MTNEKKEVTKAMAKDILETFTGELNEAYSEEEEKQRQERIKQSIDEQNIYEDIADYKSKTGKRFRRTKDQMERGLNKDEAFSEFMTENYPLE